jgi:hypothetical protein
MPVRAGRIQTGRSTARAANLCTQQQVICAAPMSEPEHLRAEQLADVLRPCAGGGASASPVQRAVWSQRLGGPCSARGLRLLRVTPVPEQMLESLDSWPWLPGLMRPLPSRFEWSGLSFMVMSRTRGRHHWCVGDGIRPAGEGARRPLRRAWWRGGPSAAHGGLGSTRRVNSSH